VESTPGVGSAFRFSFDCDILQENPHSDQPLLTLKGLKSFIVDDNAVNRSILQGFCHIWEMESRSADDGFSALEMLNDAATQGWIPDVILMDIHMPGLDGWETCSRIRSSPVLSGCSIIVMTSASSQRDSSLRQSLGIDGYQLKPLIQDDLRESIRAVISKQAPVPATAASAADQLDTASRKFSILVAEDVVINQILIKRILEKQGHSVHIAENGEEALHAWQNSRFDLIFMDIEMPVMDGVDTTAAIRVIEQEQGCHTPICAMTAHAVHGDAERFMAAGMDGYISKPFKSSDVVNSITRLTSTTGINSAAAQKQ
jgi:CheY-like chemotaxis protein